ncbi:GNAT family N-acetyltransferase [Kangiella sp. M94]
MISFYRCKPYTMEYLFNSPHFNYRLISPSDSEEFIRIYTNDILMQHISDPISEAEAVSLFDRFLRLNDSSDQKHYLFAIEDTTTLNLLGFCGVNAKMNERASRLKIGEIGVMMKEEAIGKGAGTEALNALVNYCFNKLGYDKLIGPPSSNNIASIKMLEKAGFKKETVLKSHLTIKGEQIDTPLYVIYKAD